MTSSSTGGLRLVIVGVGYWGASWIQVARESPHWDLAALVDLDDDALGRAAARRGDRARAVLSLARAAAAAVRSRRSGHRRSAGRACGGGARGIRARPPLPDREAACDDAWARACRIVEQADSSARVVMVSQQYRHRTGARTVRRLIERARRRTYRRCPCQVRPRSAACGLPVRDGGAAAVRHGDPSLRSDPRNPRAGAHNGFCGELQPDLERACRQRSRNGRAPDS